MRDYQHSTQEVEAFVNSLNSWVEAAPEGERRNRIEAKNKMVTAFRGDEATLNLSRLHLSSLPPEIGNLTRLKTLNLTRNQLTSLPEKITNLTGLTEFDLSYNQLTSLPEQITNLTGLRILYLGNNRLTSLPEQITNLTGLTRLNLSYNQLTSLPEQITNLTGLTEFDLSYNQLTSLPAGISNLTRLTVLDLDNNQLTSLPAGISNLTGLIALDLNNNQLTSLPDNLLTTRHSSGFCINLENNRIAPEEVRRLNQLITNSGSWINLNISIYEQPVVTQNTNILDTVLTSEPSPEKQQTLRNFITSDSSIPNFKQFLQETSRTSGWREHRAAMTHCLLNIITQMESSPQKKESCELLASEAFDTCGDRVALTFAQMQIALDFPDEQPVSKMTPTQLLQAAKPQAIAGFLLEAARHKVEALKQAGGILDEIEVYLAYLQPGKDLGLNLDGINMLYRRCSNVSEADLNTVISHIHTIGTDKLTAEYVYNDALLRENQHIKNICHNISNKPEFNTEQLKGENEHQQLQRCANMQTRVKEESIAAIVRAANPQNQPTLDQPLPRTQLETPSDPLRCQTPLIPSSPAQQQQPAMLQETTTTQTPPNEVTRAPTSTTQQPIGIIQCTNISNLETAPTNNQNTSSSNHGR